MEKQKIGLQSWTQRITRLLRTNETSRFLTATFFAWLLAIQATIISGPLVSQDLDSGYVGLFWLPGLVILLMNIRALYNCFTRSKLLEDTLILTGWIILCLQFNLYMPGAEPLAKLMLSQGFVVIVYHTWLNKTTSNSA